MSDCAYSYCFLIASAAVSTTFPGWRDIMQTEQVITKWAPALLQMSLDELLWRDSNEIQIKKLWEYLCTYCYLPRLSGYSVLEEAICQGLASDEFFGLAAAYSQEKARYIDLKFNRTVFNINPSDLPVKPGIALEHRSTRDWGNIAEIKN